MLGRGGVVVVVVVVEDMLYDGRSLCLCVRVCVIVVELDVRDGILMFESTSRNPKTLNSDFYKVQGDTKPLIYTSPRPFPSHSPKA